MLPDEFQSTLSVRRATHEGSRLAEGREISIHALRKESDSYVLVDGSKVLISIHALRKESDTFPPSALFLGMKISIHALRKESDVSKIGDVPLIVISIHALRKESDKRL